MQAIPLRGSAHRVARRSALGWTSAGMAFTSRVEREVRRKAGERRRIEVGECQHIAVGGLDDHIAADIGRSSRHRREIGELRCRERNSEIVSWVTPLVNW